MNIEADTNRSLNEMVHFLISNNTYSKERKQLTNGLKGKKITCKSFNTLQFKINYFYIYKLKNKTVTRPNHSEPEIN